MKPSGIEWLGDVPKHWTTPAIYMRYSSELGKMLDSAKITGYHLILYMRNVDVQWGSINFDDLPYMDIHEDDYQRYIVKSGDLLVCEGGEVGRAAIVPSVSNIFGYKRRSTGFGRLMPAKTRASCISLFCGQLTQAYLTKVVHLP